MLNKEHMRRLRHLELYKNYSLTGELCDFSSLMLSLLVASPYHCIRHFFLLRTIKSVKRVALKAQSSSLDIHYSRRCRSRIHTLAEQNRHKLPLSFHEQCSPNSMTVSHTQENHRQVQNVVLKTVTSESDVPALAHINNRALEGDPLKEWMRLFTERNEYDTTVKAVTESLTDPTYQIVKAVIPDPDAKIGSGEKVVGFVHWFCGWIQLEKVDPFAEKVLAPNQEVNDVKDVASNMAERLEGKAEELENGPTQSDEDAARAARLRAGEVKYVDSRNHYIAAIRGKKHMFIRRIMVLPEYQRRGIAGKLMKVVTDEADRQKIVCWLFARPAGMKLYEKVGYKTIAETDMNEPEFGFECVPTKAMMRLAQPVPE